MWVLMVMLGHQNMATTRAYGFRHVSRQESHRLVAKVVDDALQQIETKHAWDPTLTRASVEGIEVTAAGLERLEEHRRQRRTYGGAICTDPCNPPPSIDPTHPRDGRSPCVQGHLCVSRACPRAVVLNDSLTDIAKTVAELEWKRAHTGIVRFAIGSEEQDLAYLQKTLEQWDYKKVEEHLALWRDRIERGEHVPLMFGGQH